MTPMRSHHWAWIPSALRAPSWRATTVAPVRCFSASAIASATRPKPVPLPPKPTVNEDDIIENFLKGSGPGGQKINKTTSAVQLIHKPTGLVVKSQDTRSRAQNRVIARKRLAEMLDEREHGAEARSAIQREQKRKKKSSRAKKSRRKYRKLEEEKRKTLEEGRAVMEEEMEEFDEEEEEEEEEEEGEGAAEVAPKVRPSQSEKPESPKPAG